MNNEPSPPEPNNALVSPTVTQPSATEPPPTATESQPSPPVKKSRKKLFLIAVLVLVLAGAGAAYYLTTKDKTNDTRQTGITKLALPHQPKQLNRQFGTQYFTAGYVDYEPEEFEEANIEIPKIEVVLPAPVENSTDKAVIFMNDLEVGDNNLRRLLMYDFDTKTTYVVDEDQSVGGYSNAKIMSNHFVAYTTTTQIDPLTSTTAIKVTNLLTGEKLTIMSDKSANLPASLCCSVSPDGLRMLIPQPGEFLIYQAGEKTPASFDADIQPFPDVAGNDNDDYAASQRNFGYPGIEWLNTNTFMYTKGHPKKWDVDSGGSHAKTDENGLAIYDITTGKSTDVARTGDMSIKWFVTDGKAIIFATYLPNVSGVMDENSGIVVRKIDDYTDADSQPLPLIRQTDYQSSLHYDSVFKKLYIQPSALDNLGNYNGGPSKKLQVLNTDTGEESSVTLNGFDFPNVRGIIGPGKMVINDSYATTDKYSIYSIETSSAELIFSNADN